MKLLGIKRGTSSKTNKPFAILSVMGNYTESELVEGAIGNPVKDVMLFDTLVNKVTDDMLNKEIDVLYDCGFGGKAFVRDVLLISAK